jgi:alpha-soluble NSF attachment protein
MAENEQKAIALVQEAEKKLNSSKTFLGGLFGYVVNFKPIFECL